MKTITSFRIVMIACVVLLPAYGSIARATEIDNAALLYYQALLFYEKPDGAMEQVLTDFRTGKIGSNEAIRQHIQKNRRVIDRVVQAGNLARCDWGFDYAQGIDLTFPHLPGMRRLAYLLWEEEALRREQGDYRTALERCLSLHQMALHTADRTMVTYLMAISLSNLANRIIQDTLPVAAADTERLDRLKRQVREFQERFPSIASAMAQEGQTCAMTMRKEDAPKLLGLMQEGPESAQNEPLAARIRGADDAFFARNREHWLQAIATVTRTLESGLPYDQMRAQLDGLEQRLNAEAKDDPDATLTAFSLPALRKIYQIGTAQQTHFNAVRTALDLYLARASIGRLPDALPADAPRDLFSGRPFLYEKTNTGFLLHCQAKMEPQKTQANQYEFKILP